MRGVLLGLWGFCGGSDSCSVGVQYELGIANGSALARKEILPDDERFDDANRDVCTLATYEVAGVPMDVSMVELSRGLRSWAWPTVPAHICAMHDCNSATVFVTFHAHFAIIDCKSGP